MDAAHDPVYEGGSGFGASDCAGRMVTVMTSNTRMRMRIAIPPSFQVRKMWRRTFILCAGLLNCLLSSTLLAKEQSFIHALFLHRDLQLRSCSGWDARPELRKPSRIPTAAYRSQAGLRRS